MLARPPLTCVYLVGTWPASVGTPGLLRNPLVGRPVVHVCSWHAVCTIMPRPTGQANVSEKGLEVGGKARVVLSLIWHRSATAVG